MCRRRGLKFNTNKNKATMLNEEEELECQLQADRMQLEHVSEFKYSGCVLDESGTEDPGCRRKVASGRRVARVVRSL